jgi:MSHA pilin protein MshC
MNACRQLVARPNRKRSNTFHSRFSPRPSRLKRFSPCSPWPKSPLASIEKPHISPRAGNGERGFTLIELVVTIVLVAILAAVVMPRFAGQSDFDARGFFDATASFLRYAQKSAVAQRRQVCVGFAGSSATLTIASVFGGPCDIPLAGPDGQSPCALTPPQGIAFTAAPADFSFFPSGQASADTTLAIAALPGKTLKVWAMTGYVQED